MKQYRQRIIKKFGSGDVFAWQDMPLAPLGPREVLVEIDFIGLNFADTVARKGWYRWGDAAPTCIGFEYSGEVIQKGKRTARFREGDKVFGITRRGAYAEAIVTDEKQLWKVPQYLSLKQAAAFPVIYLTAWHCLIEVLRIRSKEDILIHSVAGGVGLAALQIAKYIGLTTYGTASSDEKLNLAKQYKLDHGINYKKEDFTEVLQELAPEGIQFVLDSIGGKTLQRSYECLGPSGHVLSIGGADLLPKMWPETFLKNVPKLPWTAWKNYFSPLQLIQENKSISGAQMLLLFDRDLKIHHYMQKLLQLFSQKDIEPPYIGRIFPLEQSYEAHQYMEQRKSKGKLLLKARPDSSYSSPPTKSPYPDNPSTA